MKTYEKNNAIAAQGWRLVQVTRAQVANGEALEALARCGVRVEADSRRDRGRTFPVDCNHTYGVDLGNRCARCGAVQHSLP